jgi:DNA-binding transcriptional LysR family regulator
MNNLTGMMVFAQVVQSGSFSKAADELGMSKSSVSKKVSFLEDRLGVRLLNRTTRKLSLTEVGHVFFERCERIMNEAEEAELAITKLQDEPRGQLKLSAPVSFGLVYLGKPLAEFVKRYPDLSVDLHLNDRYVDIVDEGFDMSIRIGRLPDSSLIAKKVGTSRLITVASPNYWKEKGKPAHPNDLIDHDCVSYTLALAPQVWMYEDQGKELAVRIEPNHTANNGNVILDMVAAGAGVALSPSFICAPYLKEGSLETALVDYEKEPINIYAVYPHNRHLSAKVRMFIDHLKEWFQTENRWNDL